LKKIVIAIDGFSSCGKSTLAKDLAAKLGYAYIDSGAMYRAATLYFIEHGIPLSDYNAVSEALKDIQIRFKYEAPHGNTTYLNGRNVEEKIRGMEVSSHVSEVAAISAVRKKLVEEQRKMGLDRGIVMDGRDIGTVVFPDAELKIFLTADPEVRIERRYKELMTKGQDVSKTIIQQNILERDRIDSTREDSPLMQADDAILINNSLLSTDQQLDMAFNLVQRKLT
jgi:cytidylate kinase